MIPTVTDNLFSQGTISSDLVAVSFEPATSNEVSVFTLPDKPMNHNLQVTNGELSFRKTDSSK
jgi:cathepsin E